MKDKWFVLALINTLIFAWFTYRVCHYGIDVNYLPDIGADITTSTPISVDINSVP